MSEKKVEFDLDKFEFGDKPQKLNSLVGEFEQIHNKINEQLDSFWKEGSHNGASAVFESLLNEECFTEWNDKHGFVEVLFSPFKLLIRKADMEPIDDPDPGEEDRLEGVVKLEWVGW
jgi:hypothetical protein